MDPCPPYLREKVDGLTLKAYVQPRARVTELVGEYAGQLKIRIAAPPVDSAANEALIAFLAKRLKIPKSRVQLRHGASGRQKTLFLEGITCVMWDASFRES